MQGTVRMWINAYFRRINILKLAHECLGLFQQVNLNYLCVAPSCPTVVHLNNLKVLTQSFYMIHLDISHLII